MVYGTAGLTAALCYKKLLSMNATPGDGPVLVTGSTGGVGSVAVSLLASQGYEVIACTGKSDQHDYLKGIGATSVVSGKNSKIPIRGQWAKKIWTCCRHGWRIDFK